MASKTEVKQSEKEYMEEAEAVASVSRILEQVETVGLAGLGSVEEMRQKFADYEECRNLFLEFVEKHLITEVDFGWTDERSMDKATLKKPGAEKICRWFNTHPQWIRDYDTWEMLGKPAGTVCYICQIVDNITGKIIGQGRGAETVGNKKRDANKTIKNAEKCALVDAAIYTFMLSEKFTQDNGGANQATTLTEWKRELQTDISTLRAGVKSELSDQQWIITVLTQILHKKRVDTIGEYKAVRKAIFEKDEFDLSTGEKYQK